MYIILKSWKTEKFKSALKRFKSSKKIYADIPLISLTEWDKYFLLQIFPRFIRALRVNATVLIFNDVNSYHVI